MTAKTPENFTIRIRVRPEGGGRVGLAAGITAPFDAFAAARLIGDDSDLRNTHSTITAGFADPETALEMVRRLLGLPDN